MRERSSRRAAARSGRYINRRLTMRQDPADWKNAGVKSFRDVSELDKKRKEEGGAKRRQASAGSSRSSNRFHNLEEHGYDYDEMVWSMINGAQKTGGDDGTQ